MLKRILTSIKFLYDLSHSKIDCVYLLSKIKLHVLRSNLRNKQLVHLNKAYSNVLTKSPIYITYLQQLSQVLP